MSDQNYDPNDLPPWMQGDNGPEDDEADDAPLWGGDEPRNTGRRQDDPFTGLTGQLPWNEQASDPTDFDEWLSETGALDPDNLPPEAPAKPDEADAVPDWLNDIQTDDAAPAEDVPEWLDSLDANAEEAPMADDLAAEMAPSEDEPPAEDLPDWLFNPSDEVQPPAEDTPEWLQADDAPALEDAEAISFDDWAAQSDETLAPDDDAAPGSFDDWAAQNDEALPVEEAEVLNWMGDDVPEDMTYDEWERQHEEAEFAAEADDIPLPDDLDLPDLLGDIENTGGAAPTDDYMPEWFMGVEELDDADAPDWLKGTAYGGGAAATPPPPAIEDDDDLLPDFDALLGEEEPAPASSGGIRRLTPTLSAPEDDIPLPDVTDIGGDDDFEAMFSDLAASVEPDDDDIPMPDVTDIGGADDDDIPMPDVTDIGGAEGDDIPLPDTGMFNDEQAGGDNLSWLDDLASSAPDPPPMDAPSPQDNLSLDDLLGDDVAGVPAQESGLMAMPGEDDLGFDDTFLADFGSQAPPQDKAEPLPDEVEALPTQPSDDLAEGDLPEWMRAAASTAAASDAVLLKAGGVESRFEQLPPLLLSPELQALLNRSASVVGERPPAAVIDSGPLAGVEGGLGTDTTLTQPGQLYTGQTNIALSQTQELRLATIQRVLELVQEQEKTHKVHIDYGLREDDSLDVDEDMPAPLPARRRRVRTRPKADRLIISLVLLVGLLVPFFTEVLHIADPPPDSLDDEAQPLGAAIDDLAARTPRTRLPVLVAFEYGSTGAQELDPLAEAVLRDIISNGGQPVILSSNPLGILRAQQVMRELAQDEALLRAMGRYDQDPIIVLRPSLSPPLAWPGARVGVDIAGRSRAGTLMNLIDPPPIIPAPELQTPQHYVVLRYIPGGPVGVRALTTSASLGALVFEQDIAGRETNLGVDVVNARNFAFVVVVAERYDDVRIWAEQLNDTDLPKMALVSAAAAPVARAYREAGVYDGLVSGMQGTLMYDAARNADTRAAYDAPDALDVPDPRLSRVHAATLAALLAATIISLGAFANVLRTLREGRQTG